jgi:beta-glucosidase
LSNVSCGSFWATGTLVTAVVNGTLPQYRLDDMATRIVAAWYYLNMDSPSYRQKGIGIPVNIVNPHTKVSATDPSSKSTILQAAIEGHVLVKNTNNALPLKSPKLLNLFGYDATAPPIQMPTGLMIAGMAINKWILGYSSVNLADLALAEILGGFSTTLNTASLGTLFSGGGSGATTPGRLSAPFDAFQRRAEEDDTYLLWDFSSNNPSVDPAADACIVFINQFASEAADRGSLSDTASDELVINVAKQCNNTIVAIHNAGIRIVDAWIDNPNVTAVIYAHLPGQDSGRALVDIMYGRQSPSGRLTYTVARQESDYGPLLAPTKPGNVLNDETLYPQSKGASFSSSIDGRG